jgi:uncharacterized protein (TIGR02600 family)
MAISGIHIVNSNSFHPSMKTTQPIQDRRYLRRQRAIALVIVLAMVSMMTIFMLAIFSVSRTEYASSIKYADGQGAKELADSAVSIVMAQIWDGVQRPAAGGLWASQPGAIRRYNPDGSFDRGFKLYSSAQMQVAGNEQAMLQDEPPANWPNLIGSFVDINEPVLRPAQEGESMPEVIFPIIDPRGFIPTMAGQADSPNIEGFWYSSQFNGVTPATALDDVNARLPMPVQWLYVLKNGMMGTMAGDPPLLTFVPASSDPANQATEENPIVGRIAFWTDDESCKININTAGEPTPWSTPTFSHEMDQTWAHSQPMTFEYQRYPGHPATVALSSVFFPNQPMNVFGVLGPHPNPQFVLNRKERIYEVIPKLHGGGSRGGTIPYWMLTDIAPELNVQRAIEVEGINIRNAMRERLYATVDELMFSQRVTGDRRMLQDAGASVPLFQTNRELERARFFLTAQSRAPETTMFGTPRIAMWPITDEALGVDRRTGYDNLIAFCSSAGRAVGNQTHNYFFRRRNRLSTSEDISIPRNQQLLTYLENLLSRPLPGAPGNGGYLGKYGIEDTRQMMVQMFDYIRSTNMYDGFLAPTREQLLSEPRYRSQSYPNDPAVAHRWRGLHMNRPPHRTFTPDRLSRQRSRSHAGETKVEQIADEAFPGHGQVVPSTLGNSLGIARFVTVSEVGFHFLCSADGNLDKGSYRIPNPDGSLPPPPPAPPANQYWQPTVGADPNIYSGGRTAVRLNAKPFNQPGRGEGLPLRGPMPRRYAMNNVAPPTQPLAPPYAANEPIYWYSNFPPQPPIGAYGTMAGVAETDYRNPRNHPGFWPENWNASLDRGVALQPDQKRVQMMLNLELTCVALGYEEIYPEFSMVIRGLEAFRLGTPPQQLFIAPRTGVVWKSGSPLFEQDGATPAGGAVDGSSMSQGRRTRSFQPGISSDPGYEMNIGTELYRGLGNFDLVSRFVTVQGDRMNFSGGPLVIEIYAGHQIAGAQPVQIINLPPPVVEQIPVPELVTVSSDSWRVRNVLSNNEEVQRAVNAPSWWAFNFAGVLGRWQGEYPGGFGERNVTVSVPNGNHPAGETLGRFANWSTGSDRVGFRGLPRGRAITFGFDPATGNFNNALVRIGIGQSAPGFDQPDDEYTDTGLADRLGNDRNDPGTARSPRGTDVLFSLVPRHGDTRLIAGKRVVPADDWVTHPRVMNMLRGNNRNYFAHNLSRRNSNANPGYDRGGAAAGDPVLNFRLVPRATYAGDKVPDLPADRNMTVLAARYGDFDNGVGLDRDGPWINKPDAGNTGLIWEPLEGRLRRIPTAYFQHAWSSSDAGVNYATPNRQISSPGMFGSLPTRVQAGDAWRTLLFRPHTVNHTSGFQAPAHPGAPPWFGGQVTADHHVLDFFWMPVVEPYAISEPFSTAGKINMNYQILPFNHIRRSTALHAAMKGEIISAVPTTEAARYLGLPGEVVVGASQDGIEWHRPWSNHLSLGTNRDGANSSVKYWHREIEVERLVGAGAAANAIVQGTLGQFDSRFRFVSNAFTPEQARGLFRTASQICEVHLLPKKIPAMGTLDGGDLNPAVPYNVQNMVAGNEQSNFWASRGITGDNTRERVYANLYAKLTTQSNTFRVHYRAQVVKKTRSSAANQFNVIQDRAVSEYRGSSLIERKLDHNNPAIPDYAQNPDSPPLDQFYRFRVLETKRFAP